MKYLGGLLFGLFLALLAHTLLGSISFIVLSLLYAYCLYLLFFATDLKNSYCVLAGLTAGEELLGQAHFGFAAALALLICFMGALFSQQLRFTSPYLRYIVALSISLIAYSLILFKFSGIEVRLITLLIVGGVWSVISYFLANFSKPSSYELL